MTLLVPPTDADAGGDMGGWRPRSDADLLAAQLRALAEWHLLFAVSEPDDPGKSREARLDAARRRELAEREREALQAHAESALRDDFRFGAGTVPRGLLAHRNEWLRTRVGSVLMDHGVEVVTATDDGAHAAAVIVLEQPDLVFVEDLLPTISGVQLIHRARLLAPEAFVGAHALGPIGGAALVEVGARATFSRRIPPAEIAETLMACLHGRAGTVSLT
jgi:CheY-like chemotaxis protein